jgi:hypothetical protein
MTDPMSSDVHTSLMTAIYSMLNELPEDDRTVAALAADAGEHPLIFPQDDGSIRVEFAGYRLGTVWMSVP